MVFIATKNTLDEVKTLASKLQKRDQDIFEAYMMVYEVIGNISPLEKTLTATVKSGTNKYKTLLRNWELLKLVPERQAYRGIAQTYPVVAQLIITKNSVAIPLLDYSNARPIF